MDATGTCKPEAEVPLPPDKIDRLGRVVLESEYQCERFMNNLVLTATGSHLWLDGANTVFSALGTAFTPISTIHALTAATTVSSGLRANIDSDVFAKAAVGAYAQAIRAGYYADIQQYMNRLDGLKPSEVNYSVEVGRISAIHRGCSLGSAQDAISTTLRAPDAAPDTSKTQASKPPAGTNPPLTTGMHAPAAAATSGGRGTQGQMIIPGHQIR